MNITPRRLARWARPRRTTPLQKMDDANVQKEEQPKEILHSPAGKLMLSPAPQHATITPPKFQLAEATPQKAPPSPMVSATPPQAADPRPPEAPPPSPQEAAPQEATPTPRAEPTAPQAQTTPLIASTNQPLAIAGITAAVLAALILASGLALTGSALTGSASLSSHRLPPATHGGGSEAAPHLLSPLMRTLALPHLLSRTEVRAFDAARVSASALLGRTWLAASKRSRGTGMHLAHGAHKWARRSRVCLRNSASAAQRVATASRQIARTVAERLHAQVKQAPATALVALGTRVRVAFAIYLTLRGD